jgi:hypothetical protein
VITQALAEPGFDSAATEAERRLAAIADTSDNLNAMCYAEMWRVAQGDTSSTRQTIARYRRRARESSPEYRRFDGRLGVCPLLLEAMVEWTGSIPDSSPALDRLDSLMQLGPGLERPYDLANLWIARWRRMQGDYESAYAAIRRQVPLAIMVGLRPVYFREEGRLAALAGDTAAAIRAYDRYLTVRDDPDPVLQPVVDSVRAELAALVGEPRR